MDPFVGTGQILQHVLPEPTANMLRRAATSAPLQTAQMLPGVGPISTAAGLFGATLLAASGGKSDVSTADVDQTVAERERAYQAGRAAAGSQGFDWARTAGNVASPINYAVPGGAGAGVGARLGMAAIQGGVTGALQPVTEPGNFWGGKVWQTGTGMLTGLLTGGAIETLSKPFSWAARGVRNLLGKTGPTAADTAAQGVIDQTLNEAGIKTTDLPPEMIDGVRDQVRQAIETGGTVDRASLRAQAEAASLPIPIKLTRGQASGDPAQYAAEQEAAKIAGKGPNPALQLMTENNQKLIDNLDEMGARGAPSAAEAGTAGLAALARIDQRLDQAKNAAYSAVRDSSGRSAKLDPEAFYMNAEGALERDNAARFLPENIHQIYSDITEGRLPFTVDTMTSFDKILSRAQRTTQDGNAEHAIGLVRQALAETPVSGEAGAQAITAYQRARGLARAQFALSDPKEQTFIPGFAAMLKGMGNATHDEFIAALQGGTANIDPAQWFTKNVMRDTPAALKKLTSFLQQGGDEGRQALQSLQHGTMGAIRDSVIQGNDQIGRAVFSNNAMGKVMDRADTLRQILPTDTVNALSRLYNTSSRISGVPYKSAVNWSNTAAASINLQTARDVAGTVGNVAASALPGGRQVLAVKGVVGDLAKARAARQAAQEATEPLYATPGTAGVRAGKRAAYAAVPGVTLSTLLSGQSSQQ
jgi:hypothetical protein